MKINKLRFLLQIICIFSLGFNSLVAHGSCWSCWNDAVMVDCADDAYDFMDMVDEAIDDIDVALEDATDPLTIGSLEQARRSLQSAWDIAAIMAQAYDDLQREDTGPCPNCGSGGYDTEGNGLDPEGNPIPIDPPLPPRTDSPFDEPPVQDDGPTYV